MKREPFGGALLVAGPFLEESYFNHGVVSLVSYSQEDGAMGMVLNNLTGYRDARHIAGTGRPYT